jgi:hypothetical protein
MTELAPILYNLPVKTEYSYSRQKYEKVAHQGVWALQQALYEINPKLGVGFADGFFGERTEQAVKAYQKNRGLVADGIAGPTTQKRLIVGWKRQSENTSGVKDGLLDGFLEAEGGWLLAPVNWSVAGGVDVGVVQNRVYDLSGTTSWPLVNGIPTQELIGKVAFDPNKVAYALDARLTIGDLGKHLTSRHNAYFNDKNKIYPYTRGNHRRSWEMAALYHNWPYAATLIAKGGKLSDQEASWIPKSIRDTGVNTYAEWAEYYIDKVTKYVEW